MARLDWEQRAAEMKAWRHDLHAHPEFGFEERRTALFVAAKLREFGLDVAEGIGGTGVVGSLRVGDSSRAIALRAEMDALRIQEHGSLSYRSVVPGVMHACGHDGHTAMLLGAARELSENGGFDGTIRFIFQPAEEWGKGAAAMLDDGLMNRFPFDEIYAIHNLPGLPIGQFETRPGPIMSAEDNFGIVLSGVGGHAARPHEGREVMVAACATVLNLQTIVARRLNSVDIAVLSVTELTTDGTRNALPGEARILGDARSFSPEVSAMIERSVRDIADGTARAYGCTASIEYSREFIPLVNDEMASITCLEAAAGVFGASAVRTRSEPMTASEDFARFLDHVPGCFAFVGNGSSKPLHNPGYDFNDEALILGAQYHAALARKRSSVC